MSPSRFLSEKGAQPFGLLGTQLFGLVTVRPRRCSVIRSLRYSTIRSSMATSIPAFGHYASQVLGHSSSRLNRSAPLPFGLVGTKPFGLLGTQSFSLATVRPRRYSASFGLTGLVYWEALKELLGHRRPISSTGKFSRNSWVTDDQFRLLGSSLGTLGPRTTNFVIGSSSGTLGPQTTNLELLGHERPFKSWGTVNLIRASSTEQSLLLDHSAVIFDCYLPLEQPMAKFKKRTHKAHRSVHI
ncbi:hypothetical protein V8G54_013237 [Vigna mungo]|uniref:Uncharacterized protein n=1 Tax=Vigna mungo TaxID=3915 RepID=A0AAQ3NSL5_VIGMU